MSLPLLDLDPATKWFVIAVALLTIIYAAVRPFLRKKDPLAKPPAFGSLAQQRSVERQMQSVLLEMSEMARQITAQLDTRSAKLEALIREADEKIATMKSQPAAPPQNPPRAALQNQPPPPPAGSPFMAESTDQPMIDPRHALVYALADQGRSPKDIAQELNRPSGEIELILALRR
jgi:DNA-binding protein H-NS